jgi:hypothetical protein
LGSPDPAPRLWRHLRDIRDRQLPGLLPIAGDARTLAISEESAVRRRAMRAMAAAHAAPHSTLHVDGIGPIAQYHNYVDCAEEKGLHLFSRDYRQQCLNSKCFIKKTTMPPKNNYTKPSAISWADVAEEETLDNMADREGQRLLREDSTPFTTPKFVSHVPYSVHSAPHPHQRGGGPRPTAHARSPGANQQTKIYTGHHTQKAGGARPTPVVILI